MSNWKTIDGKAKSFTINLVGSFWIIIAVEAIIEPQSLQFGCLLFSHWSLYFLYHPKSTKWDICEK